MPIAVRPAPRTMAGVAAAAGLRGRRAAVLSRRRPAAELARGDVPGGPDHLVVSEVVTGGASASDELIELYNPTASPLPLDGLEVIYVTASGATVSRRAAWGSTRRACRPGPRARRERGRIYAAIADATYAIRDGRHRRQRRDPHPGRHDRHRRGRLGNDAEHLARGLGRLRLPPPARASSACPAERSAPPRTPDDNAADFADRLVPEPQNLGSPPTPAGPPLARARPPRRHRRHAARHAAPTPVPTPRASVLSIGDARALPDGATATIEGVALTASDFHDGGGFVADASGGIAVLLTMARSRRGDQLRLTGEIDDRFSQRTLRADAAAASSSATGTDPAPIAATTGAIGEELEGRLVRIDGVVVGTAERRSRPGSPSTSMTAAARLGSSSAPATGIDASAWDAGTRVDLVGIAGQRDSSGIRDGRLPGDAARPGDVLARRGDAAAERARDRAQHPVRADGVTPISDRCGTARKERPAPDPRGRDPAARARRSADGGPPGRDRRDRPAARRRCRSPPARRARRGRRHALDKERHGDAARHRRRRHLARRPAPSRRRARVRTGDAGEAHEALLVVARGRDRRVGPRVVDRQRPFEIDDGSGPLRVSLRRVLRADRGRSRPAPGSRSRRPGPGDDRAQPDGGYRIWPRAAGEVRVTAPTGGDPRPGRCGTAETGAWRVRRPPGRSTTSAPPTSPAPDRCDARRRPVAGAGGRRAAVGRPAPRRYRPVVGRRRRRLGRAAATHRARARRA